MKQGMRERVFVLQTFLRDDNGDAVEGSIKILAGTSSDKVGSAALDVFKTHRNGEVTMVHEGNSDRVLPGLLAKILDADAPEQAKEPEGLDALLGMVELP